MKVYCYHFQGWTKYIWAISMLKLPNFAQQNCLFLKKEIYLAGCELHIQTLLFLIILTLKQYVNTKTIWGSEVWNISCHDDYYQPLMTYMASIPAHSWSFFKEAGFFLGMTILPLVCSLRFMLTAVIIGQCWYLELPMPRSELSAEAKKREVFSFLLQLNARSWAQSKID